MATSQVLLPRLSTFGPTLLLSPGRSRQIRHGRQDPWLIPGIQEIFSGANPVMDHFTKRWVSMLIDESRSRWFFSGHIFLVKSHWELDWSCQLCNVVGVASEINKARFISGIHRHRQTDTHTHNVCQCVCINAHVKCNVDMHLKISWANILIYSNPHKFRNAKLHAKCQIVRLYLFLSFFLGGGDSYCRTPILVAIVPAPRCALVQDAGPQILTEGHLSRCVRRAPRLQCVTSSLRDVVGKWMTTWSMGWFVRENLHRKPA